MTTILSGARIFDGQRLHDGLAMVIEQDRIAALIPTPVEGAQIISGVLAPAFIDLQVNGGAGHQVGPATTPADLAAICAAHRRLGTAGILPTLITDTAETTARVIEAGRDCQGTPGFLGLHLEGPHLDPRRKGAHDPSLIRAMTRADQDRIAAAAADLPALLVTLAPESAQPDQIAALAAAGVVVSLGHTDCSHATAQTAFAAGARCVTHLFNAMSQLGNREPGLVGATLSGTAAAGIIADGIHVHPDTLRIAMAARQDGLFLVTDCMAFAGTELTELQLNGRRVLRRAGRLELPDGTLAGADLTMAQAIRTLITQVGIAPERALAMASRIPADLIGAADRFGTLAPGRAAELVLLSDDWALKGVWSGPEWLVPPAA
ncbi:N-acetylglucosamine-6-phosphate deacetylase [Gemmobacter denitrificans]|uniref:N-acetylglucosamine-6-phosphate deacetylase n=1 Tax=Gemmobacter denitrificans TaxID=3123040 RepID=A0ABU8BT03_9RHOB